LKYVVVVAFVHWMNLTWRRL